VITQTADMADAYLNKAGNPASIDGDAAITMEPDIDQRHATNLESLCGLSLEFLAAQRVSLGFSFQHPWLSIKRSEKWIMSQIVSIFTDWNNRNWITGPLFWLPVILTWAAWNFLYLKDVWQYGIFPYWELATFGNPRALVMLVGTVFTDGLFVILSFYTFYYLFVAFWAVNDLHR
jgi:hypothetical protein